MNASRGVIAVVLMLSVAPMLLAKNKQPLASPMLAQDSSSQRYVRQISELRQQVAELKRQVAELNAKLAEKTKSSTLDQQATCADRAYKEFDEWGYKVKENADFVGYYNATLDRCFIQTQNTLTTSKSLWFWRELYDAYSGKEYGQFAIDYDDKKNPVPVCHVILPSGEVKYCKSEDEFLTLAKTYMGK